MAQNIYNTPINPSTTSGTQLAGYLSDFRDALVSGLSGTSRPAALTQGGTWVDVTDAGSGYLYLTMYDGTSDIRIMTINTTTGTSSLGSSDSLFEIQKVSNDDVAPILSMFKRRIAGTGQALAQDELGRIVFKGYNNSSVKTEVAYFEMEMNENLTNSSKGSTLKYFAAVDGTGAVVEVFRVTNNNIGIGTLTPESKVHVVADDSLLLEQRAIDSNCTKVKIRKSRNGGQVLSLDDIAQININTIDDLASDTTVASIQVQASENHTSTSKATKVTVSNTIAGAAAQSEALVISDIIDLKRAAMVNDIQISSTNTKDADGNYRFYIVGGKLQLQKRVSGAWTLAQEWE